MKQRTKWVFFTLALIIIGTGFNQCKKIEIEDDPNMRNFVVPADFNFKSTTNINVVVKLPTTVDYSERNKRVEIYDNEPNANGKLINTGAANSSGIYETSLQLTASLQRLYIKSFAGWRILELGSGLKGFMDDYVTDYSDEYSHEAPDTIPDGIPGQVEGFQYIQTILKSGSNFVGNPGFENDDFGKQSSYSSQMTVDNKWHFTNYTKDLTTQVTESDTKVINIATTSRTYGGVTQLVEATAGEEITLTADARSLSSNGGIVRLYLIPRNASQRLLSYTNVAFSFSATNWQTKTVTVTMPASTTSCQILLWTNLYNGSRIQFDNVVVNIKGRVTDSDSDGVEDGEDAYPNDKNKAFNDYYPAAGEYGTLAFEDMWPSEGDYDFNDLVLEYQHNFIKNASNEITSLGIQYKLMAIGASINNGFGVALDVSSSKVASVKNSYSFSADNISIAANGIESGQTNATIIAFDDAFNLLKHSGGGEMGINTDPNGVYVEPAVIDIAIEFTEGLSMTELGNAPGNPFLFKTKVRGHEIHLPGYTPTDLVDRSKFGTGHDKTNEDSEYYYKTGNGLPWGMNLPVSFVYPIEKSKIITGHLKFSQWAKSGGYSFMDWYLDIEGYRDNNFLHKKNN